MAKTRYCSTETPRISLDPSSFGDLGYDRLILREVNRTRTESHADHTMIEVTREFQLCRPKILAGEYKECRPSLEKIKLSSELLKKSIERTQCPVGTTCEEYECRGDKTTFCINPRLDKWMSPGPRAHVLKTTSLLFDTCMQSWGCTITRAKAQVYLSPTNKITLKAPLHGTFVFNEGEETSLSIETGWYSILDRRPTLSADLITVNCMSSKTGEEICHDKETGLFFPYSATSVCMESSCYKFTKSSGVDVFVDENENSGKIADLLDLNKLYRITQFQSLQSSLNVQQLSRQIVHLEKLFREILFTGSSESRDNLFSALLKRKISTRPVSKEGRKEFEIQVCADNEDLATRDKMVDNTPVNPVLLKYGKDGHFHLFNDDLLSREDVPPPSFKIDSLSYQEIYDLLEHNKLSILPTENEVPLDYSVGLWTRIKKLILITGSIFGFISFLFFLGASCCIAWHRVVKNQGGNK